MPIKVEAAPSLRVGAAERPGCEATTETARPGGGFGDRKKFRGESSGSTYFSVQFFVHLFLGKISGKYFSLISEKRISGDLCIEKKSSQIVNCR